MASRQTMTALPPYLQDVAHCGWAPRLGPQSRAGAEAGSGAAGNPFTSGEYDSRTSRTVEAIPSKRQFQTPRFHSPQPEPRVREVDIDAQQRRRAISAPPEPLQMKNDKQFAAQAFKILPDIDSGLQGRRQCSDSGSQVFRQESAKRAIQVSSIDGVLSKKHYLASSPRGARSPSPECSEAMKSIDIDARVGHCRRSPARGSPSKGILPMDSPSYMITCPVKHSPSTGPRSSPRVRSYDYFEQTLEAERYAKLIGRPRAGDNKGIRRMNLALELEKREKQGKGNQEKTLSIVSTTASECSTPLSSILPHSSSKHSSNDARSIASQDSEIIQPIHSVPGLEDKLFALRAEFEDLKISALHKRALAEGAESDELDSVLDSDNQKDAYISLVLQKISEKARKSRATMPLALRRVVASLLPQEESMNEDMAHDLRNAVRTSAQTIHKIQGPRCNQSPLLGRSPRRSPRVMTSPHHGYSPRRSPRRGAGDQWVN